MQANHTNHLISETSPYLLQHAHNPVNWYPWGEEALQKAIEEDKPILVSIGYSACHWCHVMERESFEDEATASLMNEWFINIKIDREERPDLDHIYMDAVQAMTGSGGWPLNVFLTPERKPFFGGTYFPPEKAFNRPSWKEVLAGVNKGYREKKAEILSQAENLTEHLFSANSFGIQSPESATGTLFSEESLSRIAENILTNADTDWGGFGKSPKFPQTFSIGFLLRHYHYTHHPDSLQQALLSLDKMCQGGIYDHLGGGFARYSTDARWLAPHFEKMLYDNALLIGVLSEAFQITGNPAYDQVIKQTLGFIEREMTSNEQGFYSALDADSEGVEGKFYTWQKVEIDELLGEQSTLFCAFYDISEAGNWEHTNILWLKESLGGQAQKQGLDPAFLEKILEESRNTLFTHRSKRIRPLLDDKILLGWNGLMNTAYSKAFAATGIEGYKEKAIQNMGFLEAKMRGVEGNWYHTYKNGKAGIPAFLDDYAYLIEAYIHLQEITGDGNYLKKAKALTEWVILHFVEEKTGFFFYTGKSQSDVILRKKEVYDGAIPSGNAVMVRNLLYLSVVFDQQNWTEHAHDLLLSMSKAIVNYPGSFGVWAMGVSTVTRGQSEIALVGRQASRFLGPLLQRFIPDKILQVAETNSTNFPLLTGKMLPEEKERVDFYLCKNYACSEPFTELTSLLANV